MNTVPTESHADLGPFLKWAGGKRWLVRTYSGYFPSQVSRYYEPFLGGGAVFMALRPEGGRLSDKNEELINAYRAIRSDWKSVLAGLAKHQRIHSKDHYYAVRSQRPTDRTTRAIRFLYLNRTCWNGLFRVNLKGVFNVPIGTKQNVLLPTDNFHKMSTRLRKMSLAHGDFEECLGDVGRGAFVYIDPPYTVKHNINGFLKYNEQIFSWADQERLAGCVDRLAAKGAKVLISQADHSSIRTLYKGVGKQITVNRVSKIAAESGKRGPVTELLIRINY